MKRLTIKDAKAIARNFLSLGDTNSIGIAVENNVPVYAMARRTLYEHRFDDPDAGSLHRGLKRYAKYASDGVFN
jgi:hypothetical protein